VLWRIEINGKNGTPDSGIGKDIEDLGIKGVGSVETAQLYIIGGDIGRVEVKKISEELLSDPVTQRYSFSRVPDGGKGAAPGIKTGKKAVVEVTYNAGVMDPVEESVRKGILDLGIVGVDTVKTAKKYTISGKVAEKDLKTISEKLLFNKVIQHVVAGRGSYTAKNPPKYHFNLITIILLDASDRDLERISREGQLFLDLTEMRRIKDYYMKLGRNPTDIELETIAQTWSEHCAHKTFRGLITYEAGGEKRRFNNLLKETIAKATAELNKPWCVSVFKDNAGVIRFDEKYNICFKAETHNHPSAIEPYGGANTGLGGVIRDPLGTGLGAKPILNTDIFCFGEPDYPFSRLPKGALHPKRVMKGVVAGVRDYGNKMGIPTVNGAVLFDNRYIGNPLVYCGNVGLMPKEKSFKEVPKDGDLVVVVGGRTGRDGIHGATFSSGELTSESEQVSAQAVQIGNPIEEKKMADCILKARDMDLYDAITDCGAGGLSSAVGELGENTGVRVDLSEVPLKYDGLTYTEIWISEAQERMVLSVPKEKAKRLLEVFAKEDVEATVIGEFTRTRKLELFYGSEKVCDMKMEFLHGGNPKVVRKAKWKAPKYAEPRFACPKDLTPSLLGLLSNWNICSKEWIIRQYDHEVQGGSVVKPLVGVCNDGPSDAAVAIPVLGSKRGVVVSNGINPRYGDIDPYWMAASNIDEALRQITAVGGELEQVAILDNFCWGDTDQAPQLGSLVRASLGCYDASKAFGTPFISGKDSLHNEYIVGKRRVSIPGTLLISAISVTGDVTKCITMDFKEAGSLIYIVGGTFNELGGSYYFGLNGVTGNSVPTVDLKRARSVMEKLSAAIRARLVSACHDCSEGGIGVAAAEMAFAGGLGAEISLSEVPYGQKYPPSGGRRNDHILFSESNTRFIVEVSKENRAEFEKSMKGAVIGLIGRVIDSGDFAVYGLDGKVAVRTDIAEMKEAWQGPLRW